MLKQKKNYKINTSLNVLVSSEKRAKLNDSTGHNRSNEKVKNNRFFLLISLLIGFLKRENSVKRKKNYQRYLEPFH